MRRQAACLLAWLSSLAAAGWLQAAPVPEQDLVFEVLLDDKPVGYHRFKVTDQQQQQVVEIEAKFKVKFLGIPVYRYDHRNRETWQQGCLQSIVSRTNDDGDDFHVEGQVNSERFELTTQGGEAVIETGCVMSFAYWDKNFLQQSSLLNSQNGEYLPVKIVAEGVDELQVNASPVRASRHRLGNSEQAIDITVWHAVDDGRWLSLESRVEGGRVIRYRLAGPQEIDALLPRGRSGEAAEGGSTDQGSRQ